MLSRALPRDLLCSDGWPTFTVFVKVGIHAAGNHAVEYKSRMEFREQHAKSKQQASRVRGPHLYKERKGGPPVRLATEWLDSYLKRPRSHSSMRTGVAVMTTKLGG
jgi:hypothetical protein